MSTAEHAHTSPQHIEHHTTWHWQRDIALGLSLLTFLGANSGIVSAIQWNIQTIKHTFENPPSTSGGIVPLPENPRPQTPICETKKEPQWNKEPHIIEPPPPLPKKGTGDYFQPCIKTQTY